MAILLLTFVPLVVAAGAAFLAPRAPRCLPPRAATLLLTAVALTTALATGLLLGLAAYVGTVDLLPLIHPGDWSARSLRADVPIPSPVAAAAGVLALLLIVRTCVHLVRVARSSRRTAAAAAALPSVGELAVVQDSAVHAYAVPAIAGHGGRVVVSTEMLRLLSGPQRRALLAHERAHLRHHHRYIQLARLAAVANPLLRPVARAVDHAVERWADDVAVSEVGDATVVAQAVGLAALARPVPGAQALNAGRSDVVFRVQDLLEPGGRRAWVGLLLAVAGLGCWISTAIVVAYTHGAVEIAELAGR